MSLAGAKKNLAASQPLRLEASASPGYFDSEGTPSRVTQTPGGRTNFSKLCGNVGEVRGSNGNVPVVNHLEKEFEQCKQSFDEDAKALVEIKSEQPPSNMSQDELKKLKQKFEIWKKDYKGRLRETKAKLHKIGQPEGEKVRRKWWGKRLTKNLQQLV